MESNNTDEGNSLEPRDLIKATKEGLRIEIEILCVIDHNSEIQNRFDIALHRTPWRNPVYERDTVKQPCEADPILCVYIYGFFTNKSDFAYYVRGDENILRLRRGLSVIKAYDGPIYATLASSWDALISEHDEDPSYTNTSASKTESLIHEYYFETGKLAWAKMDFDIRRTPGPIPQAAKETGASDRTNSHRDSETTQKPKDDKSTFADPYLIVPASRVPAATDISAKKRGKMKATDIGEPQADHNHSDESSRKRIKLNSPMLGIDDEIEFKNRVRGVLDTFVRSGCTADTIQSYLENQVLDFPEAESDTAPIKWTDDQRRVLTCLTDVTLLGQDLLQRKEEVGSAGDSTLDPSTFAKLEFDLENSRQNLIEAFTSVTVAIRSTGSPRERSTPDNQRKRKANLSSSLDSLSETRKEALSEVMEVTRQGLVEAIVLLSNCDWDADAAVVQWFDDRSPPRSREQSPEAGSSCMRGAEKQSIRIRTSAGSNPSDSNNYVQGEHGGCGSPIAISDDEDNALGGEVRQNPLLQQPPETEQAMTWKRMEQASITERTILTAMQKETEQAMTWEWLEQASITERTILAAMQKETENNETRQPGHKILQDSHLTDSQIDGEQAKPTDRQNGNISPNCSPEGEGQIPSHNPEELSPLRVVKREESEGPRLETLPVIPLSALPSHMQNAMNDGSLDEASMISTPSSSSTPEPGESSTSPRTTQLNNLDHPNTKNHPITRHLVEAIERTAERLKLHPTLSSVDTVVESIEPIPPTNWEEEQRRNSGQDPVQRAWENYMRACNCPDRDDCRKAWVEYSVEVWRKKTRAGEGLNVSQGPTPVVVSQGRALPIPVNEWTPVHASDEATASIRAAWKDAVKGYNASKQARGAESVRQG